MADTDTQDAPESTQEAVGDAVESKDAPASGDIQEKPAILAEDDDAPDSLMGEFMLFLKEEKKWWLAPLVIVLLLLSAVIIFAEGSAIAPFIYTIF